MLMVLNRDSAHFNMLEQQVRPTDVSDVRLLAALRQVKRVDFISADLAGLAYADTALPMGFGQTMLPPILQSKMLQALSVQENESVFEIGTGTGYFTALLAMLAKSVETVEIVPELSAMAVQNLQAGGFDNVVCHVGDAATQWPLNERVDVIVSTAAFVTIPESYLLQLEVGGRMLVVVGEGKTMEVQLVNRVAEREWQTKTVLETVIPPIINAEPQPEFEF
jgi:protein-L-isoaspartate(D-aspartate) O-methyltransferase